MGRRGNRGYRERAKADLTVAVVRCWDCGLIFPHPFPIPLPERLRQQYNVGYFASSRHEEGRLAGASFRLSVVRELLGGTGKLLEIGCGEGATLLRAREAGWEVTGTEIAPDLVGHVRDRLGLDCKLGTLAELGFPSDSFDAVLINQVLEHVEDPKSELGEIHRVLKPKGVIVIGVPNAEALPYRLANLYLRVRGSDWVTSSMSPLNPPYHLYGFSSQTLGRYLNATGFISQRVWTSTGRPELPPGGSGFLFSAEAWLNRLAYKVADRIGQGTNLWIVARKG